MIDQWNDTLASEKMRHKIWLVNWVKYACRRNVDIWPAQNLAFSICIPSFMLMNTEYFYEEMVLVSKFRIPHPGGSVVSVSYTWPGGCELDTWLRRTFFPAYFRLSPLLKHVRKVVDGFGKKIVLVLVWECQETHTCTSTTAMIWP